MDQDRIYVDHAATTAPDPRVVEAMLPYLTEFWGNPSSIYYEAREARKGFDVARRSVASVLGARPKRITYFAQSATTACNSRRAISGGQFMRKGSSPETPRLTCMIVGGS